MFYGIQSLRQIFDAHINSVARVEGIDWELPAVVILDKPEFVWRGLNLDCCRHFMSKEFVKRYIDLLAYHKFNTLHWHLTEDQAWRIEIKNILSLQTKVAIGSMMMEVNMVDFIRKKILKKLLHMQKVDL